MPLIPANILLDECRSYRDRLFPPEVREPLEEILAELDAAGNLSAEHARLSSKIAALVNYMLSLPSLGETLVFLRDQDETLLALVFDRLDCHVRALELAGRDMIEAQTSDHKEHLKWVLTQLWDDTNPRKT